MPPIEKLARPVLCRCGATHDAVMLLAGVPVIVCPSRPPGPMDLWLKGRCIILGPE